MKRPKNFGIASIEIRLYDVGADDLTLKALDDGKSTYLELKTSAEGVVLERGDLIAIGQLADDLLDLFERLDSDSEAPGAGDKPATGFTQHAETERTA